MKLRRVEWVDAGTSHGWQHAEDIAEPLDIVTVGFEVQNDKAGIVLAESIVEGVAHDGRGKDGSRTRKYGCTTFIPRGGIKKVKTLK